MSTFNAQRIVRAHLHVPSSGAWWADVALEQGALPSGPATLTLGDLSLVGGVLTAGYDQAACPRVTLAGGAGWRAPLAAPGGYASTTGVRLSTVLRDLAALAVYPGGPATGETYDAPPEVVLGPGYGWDASTMARPLRARGVLAELVSRGALPTWRVQPAGSTAFSPWPALGAADARVTILDRDRAKGVRMLGLTEAVAAILPGATLEGVTIARVVVTEDARELRATAWEA